MALKRIAGFAFSVVLLATIFSSVSSAQLGQKAFRWLGEGYGPGYNRCNPGPNSDYYNPYSAHNSMLISRLPQFQNRSFQSYSQNNLESRTVYQGVPFSVYAAPISRQTFVHPSTNQMNKNSFVPISPNDNNLPPKDSGEVDLEMDIEEIKPATTPTDPGPLDETSGYRLQSQPQHFQTGRATNLAQPGYSKAGYQKPTAKSELFNPFAEN